MQLSFFVIGIGAVLLFLPRTMWVGLAMLGIGVVVYYVNSNEPPSSVARTGQPSPQSQRAFQQAYQAYYQQAGQPQGGAGFRVTVKDPEREGYENADIRKSMTKQAPHVRDGMLNIPLELSPEISKLIDLKYAKPTRARRTRIERDREDQWIPGVA